MPSTRRFDLADVLLAAGFAGLAAWWVQHCAASLHPVLLDKSATNVWFEADPDRIFANMTDRWSDHWRQAVHPLFSLLVCLPITLAQKLTGAESLAVVRAFFVLAAGAWTACFYALLRRIGLPRPDGALFTLLVSTTAAARFWFVVPETYVYGSASLLAVMAVAARPTAPSKRGRVPEVLASAASLSFTVTNWMAGLSLHLFARRERGGSFAGAAGAAGRAALALSLVSGLWLVQKGLYPTAQFFGRSVDEVRYLNPEGSGGPVPVLRTLLVHSVVMPEVKEIHKFEGATYPYLSVQSSELDLHSVLPAVATVAWLAMLAIGVFGLLRASFRPRGSESAGSTTLARVLGLTLVGQCVLHVLYGDETFLYTLHVAPLLVLAVALAGRGPRLRPWVLALTALLVLTAAPTNQSRFRFAADHFARHPPTAQVPPPTRSER